jgi:general secretion pathway protein G
MNQRRKAFTLIELIIVVVIIGILALVAIPRYFANVEKTKKTQAIAAMHTIRNAILAYYSVNGFNPADNSWPIAANVDGDTIISLSNPTDSDWYYAYGSANGNCVIAYKLPGQTCWYGIYISTGATYPGQTCTP